MKHEYSEGFMIISVKTSNRETDHINLYRVIFIISYLTKLNLVFEYVFGVLIL